MKKSILLLCSLFTVHCSLGQQYAGQIISGKLPDYPYDTTILTTERHADCHHFYIISLNDNEGWVDTWHPNSDENAAILHTTDGGKPGKFNLS